MVTVADYLMYIGCFSTRVRGVVLGGAIVVLAVWHEFKSTSNAQLVTLCQQLCVLAFVRSSTAPVLYGGGYYLSILETPYISIDQHRGRPLVNQPLYARVAIGHQTLPFYGWSDTIPFAWFT